jgi:heterodisulfide reductase subunit A
MLQTFLCDCGGTLNQSIDFQLLKKELEEKGRASIFIHSMLCQKDGINFIREQIEKEKPRAVVLGACSKRILTHLLEGLLEGLTPQVFEIVNLREQCAWVHMNKIAATTKAKLMLQAIMEKARGSKPIEIREFKTKENVLVIGGGIAGIQASLDLANQGLNVYLIERMPTIGGKMALLVKTYPTDDCAICILGPKMADVISHPNITVLTYHEVIGVKKLQNGFKVKIRRKPRYVDVEKCTGCGICAEKCPVKVPNEWNGGLGYRKAIYIPYPQALPRKYLIDPEHCLYFQKGVCKVCEKMCPRGAPNFEEKPEEIELNAGAIIIATGFEEYDPSRLPKYGFGKLKDVITQFQLARLLDPSGPTGGRLERPSDLKRPKRIVMVQCVGSRNPETNLYCSKICCMIALKHARSLKLSHPDVDIAICYEHMRPFGRNYERYYTDCQELGIRFIHGNVVNVFERYEGELKLKVDLFDGRSIELESDLLIITCALVPAKGTEELARTLNLSLSPDGFFMELHPKLAPIDTHVDGIYICGCCQAPKDIPETLTQAIAAASRAAIPMVARKIVMDLAKAVVDEARCIGCGNCAAMCPYNAIELIKPGVARVIEAACKGCGICAAECPAMAIDLRHFKNEQLFAAIKGIAG